MKRAVLSMFDMMKRGRKPLAYTIGILFLGLAIWAYSVDRRHKILTMYCFEQGRYLSDTEIVDAGVQRLIDKLNAGKYRFEPEEKYHDVTNLFPSLEEFYEANPYCCYHVANERDRESIGPTKLSLFRSGQKIFYSTNVSFTTPRGTFRSRVSVSTCGVSSNIEVANSFPVTIRAGNLREEESIAFPDRRK